MRKRRRLYRTQRERKRIGMNEKKELFTLGTREDLKRLEDRDFEEMYEELEAIGGELGDFFDSMIYTQHERGADNNENVKDVYSSYRTYTEYYKEYIGRFGRMAVGQVVFDGVDLQLFLNRAQSLPQINWNRTNGQLRMMQCFGIMTEVARFVNQLYLSFVRHDAPVYKYAQDGARLLGYSDRRLFGKLYRAMVAKNQLSLADAVIKAFIGGNILYPKKCFQRRDAGLGVVAADYPYSFNPPSPPYNRNVIIRSVTVNGYLGRVYNQANCSLILGKGEQAALFEICNDTKDRVILSFAGTEFKLTRRGVHNIVTDAAQILFGPETTYLAAVGLLLDVAHSCEKEVCVVGHSLGGGLMQYAVAGAGMKNTYGVGFNSAGLSEHSKRTLTFARRRKAEGRICHICADTDPISPIGSQIGNVYHVDTGKKLSHSLDDLNEVFNGELVGCGV